MNSIKTSATFLRHTINQPFIDKEPWQIITITTTTILLVVWTWKLFDTNENIYTRLNRIKYNLLKKIPKIREKIDEELKSYDHKLKNDVEKRQKNSKIFQKLPSENLTNSEILNLLDNNLLLSDYDWKNGRVSGSIYIKNEKLTKLLGKCYEKSSYQNPLHPDIFPGICKMEAEIIRWTRLLFNGDENVCGSMTSGGTESIIMACKAYRDYGRNVKGIKKPNIIIPITAHTAFEKAAKYLGLKIKFIKLNPYTYQVDVNAMKCAINSNTIMLVGSAPNFPYGTMDDIESISELGVKYNIPVHVDSCLGGFLTIFMPDAGYPIRTCDFRLMGVTSISTDTHKYGFTPKGSSIILYRSLKYLHEQYTVTTDWPGGIYASPTISGSRPGGSIAVCWATMLSIGHNGYIEMTRNIIYTTEYILKGLKRIDGIFIFGQPATSVIAIGSNLFDIYRLSAILDKLGWNLNVLQYPSGIHLCVTLVHTQSGVADKFLNDVKMGVAEVMKNPNEPIEGKMAIYGVAQQLPDRTIVTDFAKLFLDSLYHLKIDD